MMESKGTVYHIVETKQFKRDRKRVKKMGRYNQKKLEEVVSLLAKGKALPAQHRDHPLRGDWEGFRECRIQGNWLLIYQKIEDKLILQLTRTGRHTDLFEE